jgi:hypothetical protein
VGLTVREISDRAERFTSALLEELFDGMSGQKSWPELAPLYESQSVLAWDETAPVIERALAGASGDDERRLRRLLWACWSRSRSPVNMAVPLSAVSSSAGQAVRSPLVRASR